jgi:hypothetical protein
MVGGKPFQRMLRVPRQIFRDDPEAINIGHDTSEGNKSAFLAIQ